MWIREPKYPFKAEELDCFARRVSEKCREWIHPWDLTAKIKSDQSPVSEIDIQLNNWLLNQPELKEWSVISEESLDQVEGIFPAIVVDPIDGTRELLRGLPEVCVSIAWCRSNSWSHCQALLLNPYTGFTLHSSMVPSWIPKYSSITPHPQKRLLGFVSRSEFEAALYEKILAQNKVALTPRGSIAFKLGLLASGACDFVVTLKPKKAWDILAGTILCKQRGLEFYDAKGRVDLLSLEPCEPPLLWCAPSFYESLFPLFFAAQTDKND
jgi:myo-inositol-1(or 4)-monophosphatase